jgi:hypothetical protein
VVTSKQAASIDIEGLLVINHLFPDKKVTVLNVVLLNIAS